MRVIELTIALIGLSLFGSEAFLGDFGLAINDKSGKPIVETDPDQTAKILKTGLTGVEMGIKAIKTGKPTQATTTTESPIRNKRLKGRANHFVIIRYFNPRRRYPSQRQQIRNTFPPFSMGTQLRFHQPDYYYDFV